MAESGPLDLRGADGARVSEMINADLVRRLVASQFPQWAELPVQPVADGGWDNRTFHLGTEMTVRLPSAAGYTGQIEKEHRWLPYLAPGLPLPIPTPLARGRPGQGYPYEWSIYRWLDGVPASVGRIADLAEFALGLAEFLRALQRIDPRGGPPPSGHGGFRGGPVGFYDAEARAAVDALADELPARRALAIWEEALASTWAGPPVWFHGDIATGNLLLRDGRLAAVIDFGCSGVGDPACDTVIAWTLFAGESRHTFRARLAVDPDTWARGRGWALWKALITVAGSPGSESVNVSSARRTLRRLLEDDR